MGVECAGSTIAFISILAKMIAGENKP